MSDLDWRLLFDVSLEAGRITRPAVFTYQDSGFDAFLLLLEGVRILLANRGSARRCRPFEVGRNT